MLLLLLLLLARLGGDAPRVPSGRDGGVAGRPRVRPRGGAGVQVEGVVLLLRHDSRHWHLVHENLEKFTAMFCYT